MYNVTIKTLDGRDSFFTIEDDALVSTFKDQIFERLAIPVAQQRLIFQGRVLQDDAILKTCSVEDKVVHLVPRPPPSAVPRSDTANDQRQAGSTPSVTTSGSMAGGMATFFPFPWNSGSGGVGLDVAQTIQDITAGILSGVGNELGRSAEQMHMVSGIGGRGGDPHQFMSRNMATVEITFNRLHRQASHLLRRIMRQPISVSAQDTPVDEGTGDEEGLGENHISSIPGTLTSSPSYSSEERLADGNAQPQTDHQEAALDVVTGDSSCQLPFHNSPTAGTLREDAETGEAELDVTVQSPMSVDYGDGQVSSVDATIAFVTVDGGHTPADVAANTVTDAPAGGATVQPPAASTTTGAAGSSTTSRPNIGKLANMISRHRQLWRSVEPYLDQCESMLRREHQLQRQDNMEQQCGEEEVCNEPNVEVSSQNNTIDDPAGQENRDVWHQRFFNQVSRLLHFHAHMLHLISDLHVISLPPTTNLTTVTNTTDSSDQSLGTNGNIEPPQPTVPAMTQNSASSAAPRISQEHRRRPRRVLIGGSWVRNRANLDMHPHVIWSTAPGVPTPTPAPVTPRSTGQIPGTPPLDRRRSQSATDVHRGAGSTAATPATQQQNTTSVNANVGIFPGSLNASSGLPISVRPQFLSSMGGSGGAGGTAAIIHRVDIPLVSMNMINIPSAHFIAMPDVGGAQVPIVRASGANGGTGATISAEVIATADSNVAIAPALSATIITTEAPSIASVNTATSSSASIGGQPIFVTASDRGGGTGGTPLPGVMMGPIDPFLPCHSRHFGHEAHRQHPQHRNALFTMGGLNPFQSSASAAPINQTTASPLSGSASHAGVASSTAATGATHSAGSQSSTDANRFHIPTGDMLQQFASVISAATSAAASTASIGGQQPFSFMVSSETTPIHLTVSTSSSRPHGEAQPTETDGGTTNTASSATASEPGATGTTGDQSSGLSSWLFGEDSPFSSALSMVSTLLHPNPDGARDQQQRRGTAEPSTGETSATQPPPLTTPKWAEPAGLATSTNVDKALGQAMLPTRLTAVYHVLTLVAETLVDAVWLRLAQQIAYEHPSGDQLRLDEDLGSGGRTTDGSTTNDPRSASVSTGFLMDVLDALMGELHRSIPSSVTPSGFRDSNLDNLRPILHHLITHADRVVLRGGSQTCLPDMLVNSILDSHLSDSELSSCDLAVERRTLEWINQQLGTGTRIVDVRGSIARFLRAHLTLQLDLWRTSPTNVGFGSILLMTFRHGWIELFSLVESLVGQLTSAIGLPAPPTSSTSVLDFEHIRGSLRRFASRFEGPDASFCQLLISAIDHCFDRYSSVDEAVRQQRRANPPTQAMVFRSTLPNLEQMETNGTNSDADMDDANFVDASDDLIPQTTVVQKETVQTAVGQSVQVSNEPGAATLPTGITRCSSLPSWSNMEPVTCPLDPHSSRRQMLQATVAPGSPTTSSDSTPPSEDWRAVLPADWVHVVAEDVTLMAATGRGGDQQHHRPFEMGNIGSEWFSDAYLAGMPAKRRKVMQEQKLSLVKTPNVLLNECLTDAIRTSGCNPPETRAVNTPRQAPPSYPLPADTTEPSLNDEETNSTAALPNATREQVELVLALRNLVSERIANRLVTDPDFDATMFPMSSKVFNKSADGKDNNNKLA